MPENQHSYLRRLPREFYCGRAVVLWSMTMGNRRTGSLSENLHHCFREILLHTQHREALLCPGYTLMPDHFHIVWMGSSETSDQLRAGAFLRRQLNAALRALIPAFELQAQGHERVLREHERERGAFRDAVHYVFQNPVRARAVTRAEEWPFSGALVCGYPDLDWRDSDFWDRFWKIHAIEVRVP